ncbi:TRAP transporter fused permease subunit [Photobacterium sp. WH77]|uniref:TRAP transporter fused permease subunit n=1 Tax=Photobacterium arenosum TaxID=2774143 RepID=A0ABR9BLF4_9GAMM|nr:MULTISPECIES: TRAP transporter fused permease subunit [Photobacterium]MBD8512480.1 TRAP transporter fused permease subunit [Photobacterium arenosum]MCG2835950.1 TRAP transporter fused permease subunit [Photobacterium sp. WH77]MCG2843373.1 TRAP transporter fused permease subunit [Photobacterium sp. WH80]
MSTTATARHGQKLADMLMKIAAIAAIVLSAFQIWQGVTAELAAPVFRPVHLSWILVLVFLTQPLIKQSHSLPLYLAARSVDFVLSAATIWATWHIVQFDYDDISFLLDGLKGADQLAGLITIVALLEATRRSVGMVMVVIAAVFITYALFGDALPSGIASKGFELEELIRFHIFSTNGVYGAPLAIAAGVVFIFVLFGAFLQVTGAGQFFIDIAFAVAGKYRGGPAKASVIASAALGSISGSAIANTVTTGSLTIPMMKKLGYKPEQAAGIEAAASTGGQIMPPVMGAGAFVMAQFTGIPYSEILLVSIAPAILYFACTLLYVHLMACKLGLEGMDVKAGVREVLNKGWHFLAPLILVTALLMMSYSPVLVGIAGCVAILVSALCRRSSRVSLSQVLEGMKEGALMALPISVACATAGIVVGVVGQTGIGLQFTQFLLALSGGHLWSALLLIALAAVVLGMGLPVTAAYIVLSVMAVPALNDFGLPILTAHMIVFWLSQTSNVTPPIALAAFAGAGIANASPMRSAVQAFKLAQGFFLIPAMMAFSGLILGDGETLHFVIGIATTAGLIIAFAGGIEGRLINPLNKPFRVILLALALMMLFMDDSVRLAALVAVIGIVVVNTKLGRKKVEMTH